MEGSSFQISFRGSYRFDAPPEALWEALGRTDLYSSWWRWMRRVEVAGRVPERGSEVTFAVLAPIPYRLRMGVLVTEAEHPRVIEARIDGDLTGGGRLHLHRSRNGTTVDVAWDVEVARRSLRAAIHVARPLLVRAQHWAVGVALRGFRRYLAEGDG